MLSIGNLVSGLGSIFGAKYYVSQQLAQMQAHRINKDALLKKVSGKSRIVMAEIFNQYDKQIESDKWCWVKKGNKMHVIEMNNGRLKNKNVRICSSQRHDGIFPPIAAIASSMQECPTKMDINNNTFNEVTEKMKNWVTAYSSNLEYWVLQLEALEQDIAIINIKNI